MTLPRLFVLVLAIVASYQAPLPAEETSFFVAPEGDDTHVGSKTQPFATIARAQQAVRQQKARGDLKLPVVVNLLSGTYVLEQPLVFTPADSGTAECPITYRAVVPGSAILSGGRRLRGFRQTGDRWTVTLDDVKAGRWYFNQLYVNGHRRPRARTPNDGSYFRTRSALPGKDSSWGFRAAKGDLRAWENLDDVVFVVFGSWYNTIHYVDQLDATAQTVRFTNKAGRPFNWYEKNLRYYVENIAEGLDAPGEWYLDRKTGVLTYCPLPDETLESANVVAPVVPQTLIQFQGEPGNGRYVEHVRLQGLQIRHTDAHLPKDLYDGRQGATVQQAGITADAARHCVIEDCEIANMGEHGIWLRDDCHHNLVRRCHVHDLGGGGIYVGEKWRWGNDCPGWPGYRKYEDIPHFTEHNTVDNCFVHDGGYQFTGAIGIWVGQASHTRVAHNDVCDMSYSGISVGWDWSGHKSTAHHNVIEENHLHHLGHGRMNDMAGIYTLGVSEGTLVRRNVIHDVQAYQSPVGYCLGAGVYLDQSSAELTVENNICYDISNAGFFLHHGANNRIVNNVFADIQGKGRIGWGMYFTARAGHNDGGNLATQNIVYGPSAKAGKATQQVKRGTPKGRDAFVDVDRNVYYTTGKDKLVFSVAHNDEPAGLRSFDDWQKAGYDRQSLVVDPRFVDAPHHDYRLQEDSPARNLGIQSIDLSEVGLYGDAAWTELPRRTQLRQPDMVTDFRPMVTLVLAENYEDMPLGRVPDHVQKADRTKGAVIEVTDRIAADGKRCLRFADAPGLEAAYHPNRVWRDLLVPKGAVKLSFDCMNSQAKPATFSVELRDWSRPQYRSGPSLLFQPDGTLRIGKTGQLAYELGRWYHVEIAFRLGADAEAAFQFSFAPKGMAASPVTVPFADKQFKVLTWLGFLAMDAHRQSEFFLDNLSIDME